MATFPPVPSSSFKTAVAGQPLGEREVEEEPEEEEEEPEDGEDQETEAAGPEEELFDPDDDIED